MYHIIAETARSVKECKSVKQTPTIYPVEVGTEFEVRCYKVSVIEDAEGELDITVLGTIPADE